MKPTAFGTDAAQLTTLFPITRQWIGEFTGTVGVKARIGWGEGADRGKAEILLKDVAVDAGAVTASGINAVVTADRLSPLRHSRRPDRLDSPDGRRRAADGWRDPVRHPGRQTFRYESGMELGWRLAAGGSFRSRNE